MTTEHGRPVPLSGEAVSEEPAGVVTASAGVLPIHSDEWLTVYAGDCRDVLRTLPDESVHCVVTSPPYWGLRDYGTDGQLGLEPTPELYVENMVAVFREVRRVLRNDGTLWLNLGDSYAGSGKGPSNNSELDRPYRGMSNISAAPNRWLSVPDGIKQKDLVGIPWMVAFALRADGWYLRSDIIWAKPNPMPESVTDRPTKSHEYLFLLAKSERYYFDADVVREPHVTADDPRARPDYQVKRGRALPMPDGDVQRIGTVGPSTWPTTGRNIRSVWTVSTQPYPGAHFATFPPKLIEPCIKAGCPTLGTVLDPFAGSGTTGLVAQSLSRRAILIDLNPVYIEQQLKRNAQTPLGLSA